MSEPRPHGSANAEERIVSALDASVQAKVLNLLEEARPSR